MMTVTWVEECDGLPYQCHLPQSWKNWNLVKLGVGPQNDFGFRVTNRNCGKNGFCGTLRFDPKTGVVLGAAMAPPPDGSLYPSF